MATSMGYNGKRRTWVSENHSRRVGVGETGRCSLYYPLGKRTVTEVLTKNKVTVDGVLHHVLNIDEEVVDEVPQEEPV